VQTGLRNAIDHPSKIKCPRQVDVASYVSRPVLVLTKSAKTAFILLSSRVIGRKMPKAEGYTPVITGTASYGDEPM